MGKRRCKPEEGNLWSIHPGSESQAGVLPKWWDYHGEDQSHQHKCCWQNNLHKHPKKGAIIEKLRIILMEILAKACTK